MSQMDEPDSAAQPLSPPPLRLLGRARAGDAAYWLAENRASARPSGDAIRSEGVGGAGLGLATTTRGTGDHEAMSSMDVAIANGEALTGRPAEAARSRLMCGDAANG
jgi:hypothetical protein